jgi:hypothetical protein
VPYIGAIKGGHVMDGYSMMAESYRKLVEQGKITEEVATPEIRIFEFLSGCSQDDYYRLFDSAAFNDIVKSYVKASCKEAELDKEQTDAVFEGLRWLLDTKTAKEICER